MDGVPYPAGLKSDLKAANEDKSSDAPSDEANTQEKKDD